jgi:glucose-6-phosphate isomerase
LKERSLIKQKTEYHTALRAKESAVINVNGQNVVPEIYDVKRKIKAFEIIAERKRIYCPYIL